MYDMTRRDSLTLNRCAEELLALPFNTVAVCCTICVFLLSTTLFAPPITDVILCDGWQSVVVSFESAQTLIDLILSALFKAHNHL